MTIILAAILTISILGLIFGLGLAVGSRIFYVKTDPRLEMIEELLPQLNCGACGYGGCADCARGLLDGKSEPSICPVATPDAHKMIAASSRNPYWLRYLAISGMLPTRTVPMEVDIISTYRPQFSMRFTWLLTFVKQLRLIPAPR